MTQRMRWVAVATALGTIGMLGAAPTAPSDSGMNESHQPTYQEFLVRTNDGSDPVMTAVGGPSSPLAEVVTDPAMDEESGAVRIPVGGQVRFDASGSTARRNEQYGGDEIVAWLWDFQDGGQANAPVVTHRFARAGVYRVTLVVHDDTGFQGRRSTMVEVGDPSCGTEPQELLIPTGDGLQVHGWVTVPAGRGPFPTILEYGPYVPGVEDPCTATVRNGYARAYVSAPGRGKSTGDWDMFGRQTQQGGYDAIEWLAAQPWSNGKVGLYGLSGPAVGALLTAGARPPHLACAATMTSYADLYRDMVTAGGVPNSDTFVNAWLHTLTVQDAQTVYSSGIDSPAGPVPGVGPNGEVVDHGVTNTTRAADLLSKPYYDEWWEERNIVAYPPPTIPILYYGNARDLWPRATVEIAKWIAPGGGRVVQLHGGHGAGDATGWQAPRDNSIWFDWCLKGNVTGADRRPDVLTLTTYGGDAAVPFSFGRWEALDGFLTDMVEPLQLHLRATGSNDERPTHHGLSPEPAAAGEPPSPLPWSPVQGATSGTTSGTANQVAGTQEAWEASSLVFETPVLDEELPVNGPVTLQLYAQLLAPDMGLTVHLNDVWPDGTSHYISQGTLKASHLALDDDRSRYLRSDDGVQVLLQPYHPHTEEQVETLVPGETYRFDIEVWGTHNAWRPGHRLRLALAAQDLGWRTNAEPGVAALVLGDPEHPSTLNLPMLPRSRSHSPFPFRTPLAAGAAGPPTAGTPTSPPGPAPAPDGPTSVPLPATGASPLVALLAVGLLGGALALRRPA